MQQIENKYLKFLKENINLVLMTLFILGFITYKSTKSICLNTFGKKTEAVIVEKKNYFGNSPVSHEYSYSYMFKVNNKEYYGDSHDSAFRIGEKVVIEYVPFYPKFNQINDVELPDNPDPQ